jgi:hypothetical protein
MRELMTLDLPTFDRPRKATSGSTGAGNWLGSLTDIMKRAKTRINQFAVSSEKLQARLAQKLKMTRCNFPGILDAESAESERPLVFDIFRLDRFVPVPEIKNCGDHYANPQATEKEHAVGGKPD